MAALRVAKLHERAVLPARASAGAAGYDLAACAAAVVPAWGRALVPTGLALALPPGTYGRVAPRSGLSVRAGLAVGAGVVDPDYRGELMVLLINLSGADFIVRPGDRVAQLVLERISTPEVEACASPAELGDTARQAGGFGSTGV